MARNQAGGLGTRFSKKSSILVYLLLGWYVTTASTLVDAIDGAEDNPVDDTAVNERKEAEGRLNKLRNSATSYRELGKFKEMSQDLQEAKTLARSLYGEKSSMYAQTLGEMGDGYAAFKMFDKAAPALREAMDIYQSAQGVDSALFVITSEKLAEVYTIQKKYKEALKLYKKQLELIRSNLGDRHVAYVMCLKNIAKQYAYLKKYKSALKAIDKLNKQLEDPDGGFTLETARFVTGLHADNEKRREELHAMVFEDRADILTKLERFDEALAAQERGVKYQKLAFGDNSMAVAFSLNRVAGIYHAQGKLELSIPYLEEAVEIAKKVHGKDHNLVVQGQDMIARLKRDVTQRTAAGNSDDFETGDKIHGTVKEDL